MAESGSKRFDREPRVIAGDWAEAEPWDAPPMVISRCVVHPMHVGCEAGRADCVTESFGYEPPEARCWTDGDDLEPQPLVLRSYQPARGRSDA